MATRENREGAPIGADAVQKRDFVRGVTVFPLAALTCRVILTLGGNSQDWGVGFRRACRKCAGTRRRDLDACRGIGAQDIQDQRARIDGWIGACGGCRRVCVGRFLQRYGDEATSVRRAGFYSHADTD